MNLKTGNGVTENDSLIFCSKKNKENFQNSEFFIALLPHSYCSVEDRVICIIMNKFVITFVTTQLIYALK